MFCPHCGKNISDDAKYCPSCGSDVSKYHQASNSDYCLLTITRSNQFYVINPPIKIIIDDQFHYALENGHSLQIPLAIGNHKIFFSCSFRKKTINININQDGLIGVKFNRISGSIEVQSGAFDVLF